MRPVVCFGEALIDFLQTGEQLDGSLSLKHYCQYPGGAPANAAVAVAKLGGKSFFAGQVGADFFGDFIAQALTGYGVDISFLSRHDEAKTALAFVMLDDDGDRSFSFHRQQTADVLFSAHQIDEQWFVQQPLFHFCSNTLTEDGIAQTTKIAVERAKHHNSLISFDVNLRHNLWSNGFANIKLVNELVFRSDLIKFSRDELDYLAEGNTYSYADKCFHHGVKLIVVTDGENDIEYLTATENHFISVPRVKVVDTTAGGDSFTGALLYALSQFSEPKAALTSLDVLTKLIQFASFCAAHTVTKPGAFPALPCFNDIKAHWPTELLC